MWVVSEAKALKRKGWTEFPSPCGVWVVSLHPRDRLHQEEVSVPLRGVGCFLWKHCTREDLAGFRPLAGCGLFRTRVYLSWFLSCFHPLAGCGLFQIMKAINAEYEVSVPLRGVGCFTKEMMNDKEIKVSVPLRGVGCFDKRECYFDAYRFPSPCGVWVVSL